MYAPKTLPHRRDVGGSSVAKFPAKGANIKNAEALGGCSRATSGGGRVGPSFVRTGNRYDVAGGLDGRRDRTGLRAGALIDPTLVSE